MLKIGNYIACSFNLSTLRGYLYSFSVIWGHPFCLLSGSLEVVRVSEVENVYSKVNLGHVWFAHCIEVVHILQSLLLEVSL